MSNNLFKRLIVLYFLLFSFSIIQVQGQTKKELSRYEIQAKENFDAKKFKEALPLYVLLDSIKPGTPSFIYNIIVCYMGTNSHENGLIYIEKGKPLADLMPADFHLYAAKAYHVNYKFDEAKKSYNNYLTFLKKNKKVDANLLKFVERDIQMCDNALELIANPLDIEIKNLGPVINSQYSDYGPVISADESTIIFTSNRPNSTTVFSNDSPSEYLDDIYVSYKTNKGWSEPVNIGTNINTQGHDAAVALSADGQKLLIYRSDKGNLGLSSTGDIWISELQGDVWTKAVKLPADINTKSWEPSASFSADERTLFFSSDRKGGLGGTDIYSVKKLPTGEWAVPMNLGPSINTPYNEDSPFMHPDGKTLYFASEGHKSMGGYDIFMSEYDQELKTWSVPKNLGYPINTPHDDIYFSWSADGTTAFFSSYRKDGQGEVDIYSANVNNETASVLLMKGFIIDSLSLNPVQATIKVTNKASGELVGIFHSNSATGKFLVVLNKGTYALSVESESYSLSVDEIDLTDLDGYKEVDNNIKLVPLQK
jgi:hypothetical protein